MNEEIVVIDYGMGNVGSVLNMLHRIGAKARLSTSPGDVCVAKKLILPGVGAFDAGMTALYAAGLPDALREAVLQRQALLLGICLGMQLLLNESEEGASAGLGFIPGRVCKFRVQEQALSVPHMGWNTVRPTRKSVLFQNGGEEERFYFVHSYYATCEDSGHVAGTAHYGHEFAAAIERDRIFGTQFHPEKSHRFGMRLLARFAEA